MKFVNEPVFSEYDLDPSNKNEIGDPSLGYPQISIRTNRTAERTDLNKVIALANEVADKYPNDKDERAMAVIDKLTSVFGGGGFGHAWIIIFKSEKDYVSYAYHEKYGYVRNGDTNGQTNDTASRPFSFEKIIPVNEQQISFLEGTYIPSLNLFSSYIGKAWGQAPMEGRKGVYTPLTNCSWFAGSLWNSIAIWNGPGFKNSIAFEQTFIGYNHAERWGIDALKLVLVVADPGMIAESLKK